MQRVEIRGLGLEDAPVKAFGFGKTTRLVMRDGGGEQPGGLRYGIR